MTEVDAGYTGAIELPTYDSAEEASPPGVFLSWWQIARALVVWLLIIAASWVPIIAAGVWVYRRLHAH